MKRLGYLIMAVGMIMIAMAGGLLIYNAIDEQRVERKTEAIVNAIEERMIQNIENDETDQKLLEETEETTIKLDGKTYMGYLVIENLGLKLPVNEQWTYTDLKNTPCRFYGSAANQNLVIVAHNYTSHFGNLTLLNPGDIITFIDTENTVYTYTIERITVTDPYNVEGVVQSGYALSLVTCTYGGANRIVVQCDIKI